MATIEKNAKAYTELINRLEDMKDAIKKQNYGIAMDILYKPYPEFQIATSTELKESEDEKIRKTIYNCVKWFGFDSCFFKDVSQEECLAWLEKQGKNNMGISEATKQKLEDSLNDALEKETPESFNEFLDAADKVEPKFHEGEWIIHQGTENIYQVTAIVDNQYQLKYGDNYTVQKCADVDRCARLWNIAKDAKDGDLIYVSTGEKGIQAIFHEYKNRTIFFHCYLCSDFVQDCCMPIGSVELAYPLQKVHYKKFFEKMHEAGYEWDSEHKQLKKIELKPDDLPNGEDYGIDSLYHAVRILEKALGEVDGYQSDDGILEHKCAITAVKKLYEQKPAETEKGTNGNEREIPNSALSDGDIVAIDCAVDVLSKDLPSLAASIERLKSLRPQNTWKPSEEQIEALLKLEEMHVLEHEKNQENAHLYMMVKSIREQLLKLREE